MAGKTQCLDRSCAGWGSATEFFSSFLGGESLWFCRLAEEADQSLDVLGRRSQEELLAHELQSSQAETALRKIRLLLKHPIVIDGRNLYPIHEVTNAGLIYHSIGRAVGVPESMSYTEKHRDAWLPFALPTNIRPAVAG